MKAKIQKIVSLCIVFVMLAATVSYASPTTVPGIFYNLEVYYTSESQVRCSSEANFFGTYDPDDSDNDRICIYGECRGGAVYSYRTYLKIKVFDGMGFNQRFSTSSTTSGSRLVTHHMNEDSHELYQATGSLEDGSYNLSDSDDRWDAIYVYRWSSPMCGWVEI